MLHTFAHPPQGIIFHSTRSGQSWDVNKEFEVTVNYVKNGAAGLGWNATIGNNVVAIHGPSDKWGWNARMHSRDYLAIEFAQAKLGDTITDAQIEAAAYYIKNYCQGVPYYFPEHRELPAGIADGKSDIGADQHVPERVKLKLLQT